MPTIAVINPHKRGRKARRASAFRKNPRRRYRRNPEALETMSNGLKPALIGAGGALGVNLFSNYTIGYLPTSLQSGTGLYLYRLALAGLLLAYGKKARHGAATAAAEGAAILALANLLQSMAVSAGITSLSGPVSPAASFSRLIGTANASPGGLPQNPSQRYLGRADKERKAQMGKLLMFRGSTTQQGLGKILMRGA